MWPGVAAGSVPGDVIIIFRPLLPDLLEATGITQCTPCYPPITDNHAYWNLLSHYSANSFMLSSVDSVKQLISDYVLYQDTDRQRCKQINQLLSGIHAVDSVLDDRLVRKTLPLSGSDNDS